MLKFRVWDNENGRYTDSAHLRVHDDGALSVHGGTKYHGAENERFVIEQYTGFSDKNGKEAYEGDRFKRKHEFGVVQFVNGQWVIMRGGILLGSVAYQADEFEIIGTVHDNSSEKANSSEVEGS